jgi:hypothetical protein
MAGSLIEFKKGANNGARYFTFSDAVCPGASCDCAADLDPAGGDVGLGKDQDQMAGMATEVAISSFFHPLE